MKANYSKWRKRLAGETVVAFTEPDENDVWVLSSSRSWNGR